MIQRGTAYQYESPAPKSGSIEQNGKIVAEQIGGEIFIDGFGLCCPGNPELAAKLAKEAASVSHDGEAAYGAMSWVLPTWWLGDVKLTITTGRYGSRSV